MGALPIRDVVVIGCAYDRNRQLFWRFTPVSTDRTVWRLFEAMPKDGPDVIEKRELPGEKPHVVAYGNTAVKFADLLRVYGVETKGEHDSG